MRKIILITLLLAWSASYCQESTFYKRKIAEKIDLVNGTGIGYTIKVTDTVSGGMWFQTTINIVKGTLVRTAIKNGWMVPTGATGGGGGSMTWPATSGIPLYTGSSSWGQSITNNSANWNTAYGWGNHASAGYVTGTPWTSMGYLTSYTETDPNVPTWAKNSTKPSYTYSEVGAEASGTASGLMSSHTSTYNHANIAHGETAYGWGNHASAGYVTGTPWTSMGYLTSYTETDPIAKAVIGILKSNGSTLSAASAGTDYLSPSGSGTGLSGIVLSSNVITNITSPMRTTNISKVYSGPTTDAIRDSAIAAGALGILAGDSSKSSTGNYVTNKMLHDTLHSIHGSSYYENGNYTPDLTQNVYKKLVPGSSVSQNDGLTISADSIRILRTGDYLVQVWAVVSGTNGDDFRMRMRKNNSYTGIYGSTHISTTGTTNYSNLSYAWYISCVAGDYLSFWITNTATSGDPIISDFKIYIERKQE